MDVYEFVRQSRDPQLGLGWLMSEALGRFGFDPVAIEASLRSVVQNCTSRYGPVGMLLELFRQMRTSRSLVRALGNAFPFPVGNSFVDVRPYVVTEMLPAMRIDSAEELWRNADLQELPRSPSITSDENTMSIASCSSMEYIAKLASEMERMRELMTRYMEGKSETDSGRSSTVPSPPKHPKLGEDKIPQPPPLPPPAPPLPASFTVVSRTANKESIGAEPEQRQHTTAVHYVDMLKELPTVRLRPVNDRSPCGTPRRPPRPAMTELECVLLNHLARVRERYGSDNEDSETSTLDDDWMTST